MSIPLKLTRQDTTIVVSGPLVSLPYIDITRRVVADFGMEVSLSRPVRPSLSWPTAASLPASLFGRIVRLGWRPF